MRVEGKGQPEAFAGSAALVQGHKSDAEMDIGLKDFGLPTRVGGQPAGGGEGGDRTFDVSLAHLAQSRREIGIRGLGGKEGGRQEGDDP